MRRRIILFLSVLLAALDVGRSLYARIGALHPTTLRAADPKYARAIKWPPGSALAAH